MNSNIIDTEKSVKSYNIYEILFLAFSITVSLYAIFYYLYRIEFNLSLDINEAWNLNHTLRLLNHDDLYPEKSSLFTNNYPPISYLIYGLFSPLNIDFLSLGRYFSLISVFFIALLIFLISKNLNFSSSAATVGTLWYLQNTLITAPYYVGTNDPSFLGLFMMAGGLFFATKKISQKQFNLEASIIFQLFGGFTKHNLVTIPLISFLYIFLNNNKKNEIFIRYIITSIGVLALLIGVFSFEFGKNFIFDIVNYPREFSFLRGFQGFENLPWDVIIIAIIIYKKFSHKKEAIRYFFVLIIAFLIFFIQKMGEGVARNASFEFELLSSIAFAYFIMQTEIENSRKFKNIFYIITITRMIIAVFFCPLPKIISSDFRLDLYQRNKIVEHEINTVKEISGNVVCSITLICVLAGKENLIDGFYLQELLVKQKITRELIEQRISNHKISFYKVDPQAEWPK